MASATEPIAGPGEPALEAGSFRDPSGFLYRRDGVLLRQVNRSFGAEFDRVRASGLLDELQAAELLVAHEEAEPALAARDGAHAVLRPELLPFISHPYEWSFGQLRDAALLTLELQRRALERGLTLRDASAYNVQFRGAQPVFIDLLSFGPHTPGAPWAAYRQFCQHFLAPLLLMAYRDARCAQMLRTHLDGVPLDLASTLLPLRTRLRPGILLHLHLHAQAQRKYAEASVAEAVRGRTMSTAAVLALVESLRGLVAGLRWRIPATEWGDYEERHGYDAAALASKQRLVADFLDRVRPRTVWDLGANTGTFSRLARATADSVVAFDLDVVAVERHYQRLHAAGERAILPLVLDLANPSPALGWAHAERRSLVERGPADAVLALALVHHLAIGNNVPLEGIAAFLARLAPVAIVEFVPREDPQAQRLLRNRGDLFADYTRAHFETAVGRHFRCLDAQPVEGTERRLYLLSTDHRG